MPPTATLNRATNADTHEIGELYLASRAHALPYLRRVHTDDETRAWVRGSLIVNTPTWVARIDDMIVGFVSVHDDWVDQLYVRPGFERQGIGSQLLALAKNMNPERLVLYAFQRNAAARAFYEAHGFRAIEFGDGRGNEEQEPDILYRWPLPDSTSQDIKS